MESEVLVKARAAKAGAQELALVGTDMKNKALAYLADELERQAAYIIEANHLDIAAARNNGMSEAMLDRLKLTEQRIHDMAAGVRQVIELSDPVGRCLAEWDRPNGLHICKVTVPLGVIAIIYESRPNVTVDAAALCIKSGNACILKGGHDADCSNRAIVELIHSVLKRCGVCGKSVVELLPATHEATGALLSAVGYVDLCIPRGGKRLIEFVRDTAKVPVIETGAGVVNTYFDEFGDTEMGARIINNAKTRRVSVCNALDCLVIHRARLADLPVLCSQLAGSNVVIYADEDAYTALNGHYPQALLRHATAESYGTEFMDYAMSVKTVPSISAALEHIARFGSGHSECIITQDEGRAHTFQAHVDAACVYWNAPTSFTDGAQFGLGAEIGISTQKLGPRGPMGLEELTTYKWLVEGEGQVRE